MRPASPYIWTGEGLDATVEIFDFAIEIIYIGVIPLSHCGLKM
jgi:hypothetical protein